MSVVGLPAGYVGDVEIVGPEGYESTTVEDSYTDEVPAGDYTINIGHVELEDATTYAPQDSISLTIEEGENEEVVVDYNITIPETTTVLSQEDPGIRSIDGITVTFEAGVEGTDEIQPGQIIIGPSGVGESQLVVGEVTRREDSGEEFSVDINPLRLEEALPEGMVVFEQAEVDDQNAPLRPPMEPSPEEPEFEIGLWGHQIGQEWDRGNGNANSCVAEIPALKFRLNNLDVNPGGHYSWSGWGQDVSADMSFRYESSVALEIEGRVEAKCTQQYEMGGLSLESVCDGKLMTVVRIVSRVSPACDVSVSFKANVHGDPGEVNAVIQGDAVFDVRGGVGEGRGPWSEIRESSFTPTTEMTLQGPGLRSSLEGAFEIALGANILGLAEGKVGVEAALALETSPEEAKVPVKGKLFLRSDLFFGNWRSEIPIVQWEKDLTGGGIESEPQSPPASSEDENEDTGAPQDITAAEAESLFLEWLNQVGEGEVAHVDLEVVNGGFFEIVDGNTLYYEPPSECTNAFDPGPHCFHLTLKFPYTLQPDGSDVVRINDSLRISRASGRMGFYVVEFEEP
ncbi:hypothetical protein [Nocardiopsis lucentensis]|uniref:hypothetical protein n=1 Tax=Nocardiopsis lucentensis TaxID=53441 RepID=UPI0003684F3F|nr:hypothetical protein [Nocardiopsis lucentensis]